MGTHDRLRKFLLVFFIFLIGFTPYLRSEIIPLPNGVDIELNCQQQVYVDSLININYIITYNNEADIKDGLEIILDRSSTKNAKFLYFSQTSKNSSFTTRNGKINQTVRMTWTAKYKALKKGKFETPDYVVVRIPENLRTGLDTLDLKPIRKQISIIPPSKKIKNAQVDQVKLAKKIIKEKNPIKLRLEVDGHDFMVGDTIPCKLYILTKIEKPKFSVSQVWFSKIKKKKGDEYFYEYPEETGWEEMVFDGVNYEGALCCIINIVPSKSGEFTLPKIKVKGTARMWDTDRYFGELPLAQEFEFTTSTTPTTIFIKERTERRVKHNSSEKGGDSV